jgi:hypothetical protein
MTSRRGKEVIVPEDLSLQLFSTLLSEEHGVVQKLGCSCSMTSRGERTVLIGQIEMGDVDRFVAK